MSERVVLAQVVLPPSEDYCFSALCGQKACCTVEIRAAGAETDVAVADEEVYVLPLCHPHALHVLTAPVEQAVELFPPDEPEDPPWAR